MSKSQSNWYYFCSTGCGFCKKVEPLVEELNKENDNPEQEILRLDLADGDNENLAKELKEKYKIQCGTPWFINAETGKGFCGYREKDIIKKWLAGEDIPAPPRPKGPPPKLPFHGATKKEENAWKKEYKKWLSDNKHMPKDWLDRQRSANEIIDAPRPKSDPPRPPMGQAMASTTDEVLDKWGEDMKKWQEENKHLPNLQPVDNMVQQMKNRRNQMANQGQPGQLSANAPQLQLENRLAALETKMDKLMTHLGVK